MLRTLSLGLHSRKRQGFTLVELAIVLGVSSLLLTGLWRLMSSGSTRTRDQVVSEQHRKVVSAVQSYLETAEGQTKLAALAANGGTDTLPIPAADWTSIANCKADASMASHQGFCDYLPQGFSAVSTNPYYQTFVARIRREDDTLVGTVPRTYSFGVFTRGGQTIADTSGSRIASLIGRDGGFVYSQSVCGSVNNLCGSYGTWALNPNTIYGENMSAGHVGSVTYRGQNMTMDTFWLARKNVPGDASVGGGIDDLNTVQTNISLGGHTVWGSVDLGTNPLSYAGTIEGLSYVNAGRTANKGNPVAKFSAPCSKPSPSDSTTCDTAVEVFGDIAVTGLLSANKLYAGQFIYETSSSDSRLKKDITPLTGVLASFAEMKGYSFVMKDTGEKRYGVIAQEVEKFFPELIHQDTDGMKSVDYMGLIGPLVAAVSELKEENAKLRADIEALKAKAPSKARTKK